MHERYSGAHVEGVAQGPARRAEFSEYRSQDPASKVVFRDHVEKLLGSTVQLPAPKSVDQPECHLMPNPPSAEKRDLTAHCHLGQSVYYDKVSPELRGMRKRNFDLGRRFRTPTARELPDWARSRALTN
jgi:hypothetical protein